MTDQAKPRLTVYRGLRGSRLNTFARRCTPEVLVDLGYVRDLGSTAERNHRITQIFRAVDAQAHKIGVVGVLGARETYDSILKYATDAGYVAVLKEAECANVQLFRFFAARSGEDRSTQLEAWLNWESDERRLPIQPHDLGYRVLSFAGRSVNAPQLERLGVQLGPFRCATDPQQRSETVEWSDCIVPDDALDELDSLWGRLFWWTPSHPSPPLHSQEKEIKNEDTRP